MPDEQLVHGDLTNRVLGVFFEVWKELKSGYVESVYQRSLEIALWEAGISAEREVPIDVWFRGRKVGHFRADLIVEQRVILECKVAERIVAPHRVQVLNYLKATEHQVALILNFGPSPTFSRVVNQWGRRGRIDAETRIDADGRG